MKERKETERERERSQTWADRSVASHRKHEGHQQHKSCRILYTNSFTLLIVLAVFYSVWKLVLYLILRSPKLFFFFPNDIASGLWLHCYMFSLEKGSFKIEFRKLVSDWIRNLSTTNTHRDCIFRQLIHTALVNASASSLQYPEVWSSGRRRTYFPSWSV